MRRGSRLTPRVPAPHLTPRLTLGYYAGMCSILGHTSELVKELLPHVMALDDAALVAPVSDATRNKIPVVIIDSGLQSDQIASFVATDNFKGGELGAEELGRLLGGKGKALMLRLMEGSASTTAREDGFLSKMKAVAPGVKAVAA